MSDHAPSGQVADRWPCLGIRYVAPRGDEWPPAMADRLRELWGTGPSTARIGDILTGEFGRLVTKNAVIGKAGRMQLRRLKPSRPGIDSVPPKKRRRTRPMEPQPMRMDPVVRLEPVVRDEPRPAPRCEGVDFWSLRDHHCQWSIDEERGLKTRFCGAAVEPESRMRFCPEHRLRAFATRQPQALVVAA